MNSIKARQEIIQAIEKDDLTFAYSLANKYLLAFPGSTQLLSLKGYLEMRMGQNDTAKKTLADLLKKNPRSAEPLRYLAEIYITEEKYKDGLNTLVACINGGGMNDYVLKKLISLALFLKDFDVLKKYSKKSKHVIILNVILKEKSFDPIYVALSKYYEESIANQKIYNEIKEIDTINIITDKEFVFDPLNKYDLLKYFVYLIRSSQIKKSFVELQEYFSKSSIQSTICHIIAYQWVELLLHILKHLKDKNYCGLGLIIANSIFYIFFKDRSSVFNCINFLLENNRYYELIDVLTVDMNEHPIFIETKNIFIEIRKKHPKLTIPEINCDCNEVPDDYKFLKGFYSEKESLKYKENLLFWNLQ